MSRVFFNHIYLGTGCVCVFLGGKGGGTPLRHGHKESYKHLNFEKCNLRVGLEPTTT